MPRKDPLIDREQLWERLKYTPHSQGQRDMHFSNARFRIPCCGRRWGKSLSVGHDLTAHMFTPDSRYWIVGPSYRLAEKEFRVVLTDFVQKLGMRSQIKFSNNVKQGDMRIEIPKWNAILEVMSAERPDFLVGEGLDGVVMSEAALHKSSIWSMYIEPALSDKRGWADFPSTPRGYNYYQGLWMMGQHSDFPDYESWRFPTWDNLASYPEGIDDPEIKRIQSTVSKTHWLQEYGAEFTAFEGQIYEEFDPTVHVTRIEYNPQWANYWTFDWGFADPLCCYDIMVDPEDNVYVWREYQVRGKSTWEHAMVLRDRTSPPGFHVDMLFGDPRGADAIATMELVLGHIHANPVGWHMGVEMVKRWLKLQPNGKPKLFIDESCVELIRQIEQLRFAVDRDGHNSKEKQHDYDDHGPDALRYFFNEKFITLSGNGSLADVYAPHHRNSEAATFFQNHLRIKNEGLSVSNL